MDLDFMEGDIQDDITCELKKTIYDPSQFEYRSRGTAIRKSFAYQGEIEVKYNGISRTYRAGHNTTWPTEFLVDANRREFGSA